MQLNRESIVAFCMDANSCHLEQNHNLMFSINILCVKIGHIQVYPYNLTSVGRILHLSLYAVSCGYIIYFADYSPTLEIIIILKFLSLAVYNVLQAFGNHSCLS